MPPTNPPRLRAGERLRLSDELGAPVYTVTRVNQCAAYLARKERRQFTATDAKTGEQKQVTAEGTRVEAVSPYAFVYRISDEGEGV